VRKKADGNLPGSGGRSLQPSPKTQTAANRQYAQKLGTDPCNDLQKSKKDGLMQRSGPFDPCKWWQKSAKVLCACNACKDRAAGSRWAQGPHLAGQAEKPQLVPFLAKPFAIGP
jgi:hypothetical protein